MAESRDRPSARERIIEAYLRLLSQDSRKKVTVTAVAKSAGCNRDTFYYHFASIDDAARCALDELAPATAPHIALALTDGDALEIPDHARAHMLLIAKIARKHPRIRHHLEVMLKNLWATEFGIDQAVLASADEAVLDFMAAGTVGFICEHLADADNARAFDAAFSIIARTFGKSALGYARRRGLLSRHP